MDPTVSVPQQRWRRATQTIIATQQISRLRSAASAVQTDFEPPSLVTRIHMLLAWLTFVGYVFGLPLWSWLFNDKLGYGARLCSLDAREAKCGNVADYEKLARSLGRFRPDGSLWGCSCGEGVFGDWACVPPSASASGFSISHYVSVGPATGGLGMVAALPMLYCWMYGITNQTLMLPLMHGSDEEKRFRLDILTIVQGVFLHVCFGFFQFSSLCVFPMMHCVFVVGGLSGQILPLLPVAYYMGDHRLESRAIRRMIGVCVTALIVTKLVDLHNGGTKGTWLEQHAFWLGECSGFSVILSVPVMLSWMAALTEYTEEAGEDSRERAYADIESIGKECEPSTSADRPFARGAVGLLAVCDSEAEASRLPGCTSGLGSSP